MALKKLKELAVWMNGELTGYWNIDRHIQQFTYADSWYEFVGKRPLSLSLPLQYPGYRFTGNPEKIPNKVWNIIDKDI